MDGGEGGNFVGRTVLDRVEAGMVCINVPIPVPVGFYSFGGWGLARRRHARLRARGVHFDTRSKVVTTRWPEAEPTGADLGFPNG